MRETDFIIVGAGIIGLSITRELVRRFPGARMVVLEKEGEPAFHASGRNSGVLHAGFYYSADSLKARFTLTGNQLLTDAWSTGCPSTAAARSWWPRTRPRSKAFTS